MNGNNKRCLLDGRKGFKDQMKDVLEKNHVRARKVLWHGIGNFVRSSGSRQKVVYGSREKFSRGEKGKGESQVVGKD